MFATRCNRKGGFGWHLQAAARVHFARWRFLKQVTKKAAPDRQDYGVRNDYMKVVQPRPPGREEMLQDEHFLLRQSAAPRHGSTCLSTRHAPTGSNARQMQERGT